MVHTSTFGLKFGRLSPAVTLKIRSRSPKPYQLFIMSQCYIHANLLKNPPIGSWDIVLTRKCHANANRIRTKNNMSPSLLVGDITRCNGNLVPLQLINLSIIVNSMHNSFFPLKSNEKCSNHALLLLPSWLSLLPISTGGRSHFSLNFESSLTPAQCNDQRRSTQSDDSILR